MSTAGSQSIDIPEIENYCQRRADGLSPSEAYTIVFKVNNESDKLLVSLLANVYEQFNIVQDRIAFLEKEGMQNAA